MNLHHGIICWLVLPHDTFLCYLCVLYNSMVRYSFTWCSGDLGQQKQPPFFSPWLTTKHLCSSQHSLTPPHSRQKRQHTVIYCKCPAWPPLLNVYCVQWGMQLSRKQQGLLLPLGSRHSNQKRAPCNSV